MNGQTSQAGTNCMRELNRREKELIAKVIEKKVFYFRELFSNNFLSNVKLAVFLETKDVKIFRSENADVIRDIFEEIVTVIGLVRLLEKNDLLLKVQIEYPLKHVYYFGEVDTENQPKIEFIFGDNTLKQELANYILAEFFTTSELKIFYRNKFKTRDQIRHRQILWTSWTAILLALGTSVYSIVRQERNQQQERVELTDKLKAIDNKLDSLNFKLSDKPTVDTLNSE